MSWHNVKVLTALGKMQQSNPRELTLCERARGVFAVRAASPANLRFGPLTEGIGNRLAVRFHGGWGGGGQKKHDGTKRPNTEPPASGYSKPGNAWIV